MKRNVLGTGVLCAFIWSMAYGEEAVDGAEAGSYSYYTSESPYYSYEQNKNIYDLYYDQQVWSLTQFICLGF